MMASTRDLARSVVARYLSAMSEPEVKDLQAKLAVFKRLLDSAIAYEAEVKAMDTKDTLAPYRLVARRDSIFQLMKQLGVSALFLGILKGFQLNAADRKLIEAAAKHYSKSRQGKTPVDKIYEVYPQFTANLSQIYDACERALSKGKHHSEEGSTTVIKAGPFNLVNTGGFDAKAMELAAKVVIEATRKLTAKGLGKVCYGDIQITNTVHKGTRVLAFYTVKTDELYVRANLRGKAGPAVFSVLHELAHRLQFKFLRSKNAEINAIYRALASKDDAVLYEMKRNPDLLPKPGDKLQDGKGYLTVTEKAAHRDLAGNLYVQCTDGAKLYSIPIDDWVKFKTPNFVSRYAATSPEENFAEMVASYCDGSLPPEQLDMLLSVL